MGVSYIIHNNISIIFNMILKNHIGIKAILQLVNVITSYHHARLQHEYSNTESNTATGSTVEELSDLIPADKLQWLSIFNLKLSSVFCQIIKNIIITDIP